MAEFQQQIILAMYNTWDNSPVVEVGLEIAYLLVEGLTQWYGMYIFIYIDVCIYRTVYL